MQVTVSFSPLASATIERLMLPGETPASCADRLISQLATLSPEHFTAIFGAQRPNLVDIVRPELKCGAIVQIVGHGAGSFVGIVTNRTWREKVLQVRAVGLCGIGQGYKEWSGYYKATDVVFLEQAGHSKHISARQEALREFFRRHPEAHIQPDASSV